MATCIEVLAYRSACTGEGRICAVRKRLAQAFSDQQTEALAHMNVQKTLRRCLPFLFFCHFGIAFAGECETNFVVQKTSDGSTLTAAVIATPFPSPQDAIVALQRAAKTAGYKTKVDNRSTSEISYLIQPPDVSQSKWLFMKFTANTNKLILVSLSPADMKVEPEQMRGIQCDLLAQIDPKRAAEPIVTEQSRGAPPPLEQAKKGKVLRPKSFFDPNAAIEALKPGKATITGIACSRRSSGQETVLALAKNQAILLFPATPYLEEAIELIHTAKPGDSLEVSKLAFATRIVGQTNAEGRFQLTNLKPGRYYIFGELAFKGSFTGTRQIGTVQGSDGSSAAVNATYGYTNEYNDMLEKKVEIKRPGETVDVTVSPRYKFSLNPAKRSGNAGWRGCR
jgi:hypothetical protein